jgi:NAD(P)-dependent dehydrogenase (short-subunit alcohol dehydrogenase family)
MNTINSAFRLDGKVALVTGAGRGLGARISEVLAEAGAKVMLTDILEMEGRASAERIVAGGADASFSTLDVTDENQWSTVISKTIKTYGRLDVLVNNAGIEKAELLTKCSLESFRNTMEANVTGVFLGVKHAVLAMSPGGVSGHGGSIINISSIAGLIGAMAHTAYCTSKGAVRLLTKAAAVECARLNTGVRVNSVHPGLIETTMGLNLLQGFVDVGLSTNLEDAKAALVSMHPMGRLGEPDDVANAILYLASEASKWVTGAELSVDGGFAAS